MGSKPAPELRAVSRAATWCDPWWLAATPTSEPPAITTAAPAAIALVVPQPADDRTRVVDQYDLGQATYAMMLAAADLGIGTGHSSVGDQARARTILGVPDTHVVSYLLGVGYPADRPLRPITKPDRRPFNAVVHQGRW